MCPISGIALFTRRSGPAARKGGSGVLYYYTPGSDGHGPRFLTGGPGAAPGGVASKNGWVYMRVQGGFNLHSPESLSVVCVSQNGGLFGEFFIYINDFDPFNLTKLRGG